MNGVEATEKLADAIHAVEGFREFLLQYPTESRAAVRMFLDCYPKRNKLIMMIAGEQYDQAR